jgi:hypothetical protein
MSLITGSAYHSGLTKASGKGVFKSALARPRRKRIKGRPEALSLV